MSRAVPATPVERLLQVERIYAEPAATELARGQEVLARFPAAQIVEVASGWNVRYRSGFKGARVRELLALIERRTPWLRVRYAF